MATGKYKKKNRGANDVNTRGVVHNIVVPMGNDSDPNESHVSWAVFFAVLVVCLVLVVCIPALAIMYGDMSNATAMAMEETRKMRELRAKIMLQMQGEQ
jgi:hypothetical protein